MKKKIIVVGAYGCGNKGDDAILDGIYQVFGADYEIIPTCGNYGHLEDFLTSNTKVLSCRMDEGFNCSVMWNLIRFFPQYYRTLKNVEAVFIGGGSLIHDLTKYNLPFFVIVEILAKLRHKKVFFVGVGAGPLNTQKGRMLAKKWLNKSEGVVVRDPFDYHLLKGIGVTNVTLSADMAFAGATNNVDVSELLAKLEVVPEEYIVVTGCQWFTSKNFWDWNKMDFHNEKEKFAGALRRLIALTGKKILFLPIVFHDFSLGIELQEKLCDNRFIVAEHYYHCREMAAIVEHSFFVFGMRMHSLIFAIRCGKPFAATVYDDKVRHLLERVGMEPYIIEFDDIDSKLFEDKIRSVVEDYDKISVHLSEWAVEFKNSVKLSAQKLNQKITGGYKGNALYSAMTFQKGGLAA